MLRTLDFVVTSIVVLCLGTMAHAAPTTRTVNNGSVPNSNCVGKYSTIQAAINASAKGDIVYVCNGVYPEQLLIIQGVTLTGQSGATVKPVNMVVNAQDPEGYVSPTATIIYVQNAAGTVSISNLILDGSQNGLSGCGTNLDGIYSQSSTVVITRNAVRFIQLPDQANLGGCQVGVGIEVENVSGAANTATIEANSIHDWQKDGIDVTDLGLTVTISANTITGYGPTALIAQNGLELDYSVTGTVSTNNISDAVYTPATYGATDILTYDAGQLTISGNTLGQSQGAVVLYSDQNPATLNGTTVSSNKVSDSINYDGIDADGNGATITQNTITNSAEFGVGLFGTGNTVTNNTIVEAPVGVYLTAGSQSTVTGNKFYLTPTMIEQAAAGLRARPSPFQRR